MVTFLKLSLLTSSSFQFRFIDNWLKGRFRGLGQLVGKHPGPFILVPVILSVLCGSGMLGVEYNTDQDYLMTPTNGDGNKEKAIAESFFPTNFSDFDAPRSFNFGLYGYVMVTTKDGRSSILQPQIWDEVRKLEDLIVAISVEHEGKKYTYKDICAKWSGKCYTNSLLSFADTFAVFSEGVFRDSVENYYNNHSDKFGFEIANNISRLSEFTSKEIIDGVEKIRFLTNTTRDIISQNLDVLSTAVDGLNDLTVDLASQYKTHLAPSFSGISLPGYLGGITVQNQSIENFDMCQILSFMRGENKTREELDPDCGHPLEIYSTITDIYQHAESEVLSSKLILDKINMQIKDVLHALSFKESAEKFLGLVANVSTSIEGFAKKVQQLAKVPGDQIEINKMLEAEAVLIGGLIDSDTFPIVGEKWENEFIRMIDALATNYTNIDVSPVVSNSLRFEMARSVEKIKPILAVNTLAVLIFCMLVCCTKEVTTSKPWVGLAGVISTLAGSGAGFGICIYAGAEFTSFNYGAIFILLGIGMDSTFMLLNAWHRTDRKASVPERMGDTMAEAGVSILITNTTNILSFLIAISAPYPYVKIFCLYTGVCLLLVFIFHITFFAGCLALSGYTEEGDRSGVTLRHVPTEELTKYQQCLCLRTASYTIKKTQEEKRREEKERQDVLTGILGKAVRSTNVRISVLFLYFCYLAVCFYGICNVVVYFDKTKLIMYDSTMKKFVDVEDRLFRDKSFSISVIIRGDVNYTDEATLDRIETFLGRLEDSVYINEHLTKSWLKDFQTFTFLNSTDMVKQTEEDFVTSVHKFYQEQSVNSPYRLDVAYNPNITRIVASRFLIQGQNIRDTKAEEHMVLELRSICNDVNSQPGGMKVSVFNSYFPYTDQYLTIFDQSIQTILLTGVIVVAVSLILLPDTISAVSAMFSIISTLVGCLGLMSMWGIVLDGITLINLIMCIGFSVDFSAHFCYNYIEHRHTPGVDQEEVVERTMLCVYKPVLQGALSTLLGVIGMLYAPSYSFIIFFKVMFIVICLGLFHSLVLVPLFFRFILDLSKVADKRLSDIWHLGIFSALSKRRKEEELKSDPFKTINHM